MQPRRKRRQKGKIMKREDIKAIFAEATDEQLNKVMGLHGADIEKYKGKVTALEAENAEKKTAFDNLNAEFEKLKESNASAEDYTGGECGHILGLFYAVNPRLCLYSTGLI